MDSWNLRDQIQLPQLNSFFDQEIDPRVIHSLTLPLQKFVAIKLEGSHLGISWFNDCQEMRFLGAEKIINDQLLVDGS